MAAMKENTRKVFEYLKAHNDEDLTAADIAEVLELEKRQVDGIFTSALQRKKLGERIPAERENPDGTHDRIKLLKLTQAGMEFDLDNEVE